MGTILKEKFPKHFLACPIYRHCKPCRPFVKPILFTDTIGRVLHFSNISITQKSIIGNNFCIIL